MATTDPLTGATINDQGDAATGGFQTGRVVTDLRTMLLPRFANAAARDAAYTSAGVALVDGMMCVVAGRQQRRSGSSWLDAHAEAVATGAVAVQQSIAVGGTYAWTGVSGRPSPFIGAYMRAEMSYLARFLSGSGQQTLSTQVGVTGGSTQEGDHDAVERIPGGSGSGEDNRLIRRTQFFTCTAATFTVGYNVIVGTGGSAVVVQNPRCFVTGPYNLI